MRNPIARSQDASGSKCVNNLRERLQRACQSRETTYPRSLFGSTYARNWSLTPAPCYDSFGKERPCALTRNSLLLGNAKEMPPSETIMNIQTENDSGVLVLAVSGRVDSTNAASFETGIMESLNDNSKGLVLDLSLVEFISSAGLRAILLAARELKDRQTQFALCAVPEPVKNVLKIAGFLRLMDVIESRQLAIDRMAGASTTG